MSAPAAIGLAIGLLGGGTQLDPAFSDFRWNVDPRAAWGVQVLADRGALATGFRVLSARTTQTLGVPDPTSAAAVRLTSFEWIGEARLVETLGGTLRGGLTAGRVHLGWEPDRVAFDPGTGVPVEIALAPVDTWIGGAGLAWRRPVSGPLGAGVQVERRFFTMETAHRDGASVVTERRTFGDWSARVELSWRLLGA